MKINTKIAYSIFCSLIIAAGSQAADLMLVQKYVKRMRGKNHLYLDCHKIGKSGGAPALVEALKNNTTLTSLKLENNQIGNAEVNILVEAFKNNKTLTELTFALNYIGDEGAEASAGIIKYNKTLRTLKLSNNQFCDDGAKALAKAFKNNTTLTDLDLSFNHMSNEGIRALAKALKNNKTLVKLNLNGNLFDEEGAKAFAKTLKFNSTLMTFEHDWHGIEKNTRSNINQQLEMNRKIATIRRELMIKAALLVMGNQYDPDSRFFDLHEELVKPILDPLIQLKIQEITL